MSYFYKPLRKLINGKGEIVHTKGYIYDEYFFDIHDKGVDQEGNEYIGGLDADNMVWGAIADSENKLVLEDGTSSKDIYIGSRYDPV